MLLKVFGAGGHNGRKSRVSLLCIIWGRGFTEVNGLLQPEIKVLVVEFGGSHKLGTIVFIVDFGDFLDQVLNFYQFLGSNIFSFNSVTVSRDWVSTNSLWRSPYLLVPSSVNLFY